MPTLTRKTAGLTGNQLKLLALAAMTCDHVGVSLLPQVPWLRIIGRLALPVFAYMIAEGCRYTRSRKRYLLSLLAVAAVCQGAYFVAMGSLYQCILVTFSLSVALICLWDLQKTVPMLLGLGGVWSLCEILPAFLPGFHIDYGFCGVLLPVLIYLGKGRWQALGMTTLGLLLLAWDRGGIQWYAFGALLPLALYTGARGKLRLKYLFYIYYPLHLVLIWVIGMLL